MYKIKNVLDYRYRMIPTREEYNKYSPEFRGEPYDTIPPCISEETFAVVFDELPRLDTTSPVHNKGLYDNKRKGWVISSININLDEVIASALGISESRVSFYNLLGRLITKKFPAFVMPGEYIYTSLSFINGELTESNNPRTSNTARALDTGWDFETVSLTERFYLALTKVVEPLYPKFVYEFSKFAVMSDVFNEMPTDTEWITTALSGVREYNHIDGSTMMKSANTPEIIDGMTPEEVLNSYMSSIFHTTNNKEDNLTDTMKHFEEMVNHLVGVVAYTCFIPN